MDIGFICTAREPSPDVIIPALALAADESLYWGTSGVHLTVGFMDNPSGALRSRILLHMNAWGQWANVKFVETTTDPQVRVSRDNNDPDGLFWSYLGRHILSIKPNLKTMNLGGFTETTTDSEFYRVVRHETGHTLGFPHEHLRKEVVDRIDRDKAIAYFAKPPNSWSEAKTIANVLTPLDSSALIATQQPDPNSIMCYSLPESIMKDGVGVPGGTDIDGVDAQFVSTLYPGKARHSEWLAAVLSAID